MTILPDLPGIPSYYTPLTVESAEKAPLDALICRSFLALHRESAGSGGRIRSIEHIPFTDKKGALALTAAMFKRAVILDAPKGISSIDHLAAFLLHLEQGHAREKLLEDFSKLTTEDKTFLCYHLWQGMGRPEGDSDYYGLHEIEKDPSILRRIRTADGKNLVEKLIDIRTEQKILPELQELIGKSREEIQASAHYNLLCWFVWWHDGGKDDSHFGEEDYGRKQLAADPDRLTSCIESLIKEINNKAALIEMPGLHYEGTALPQYKDLDRQVFREMVEDLLKDDSVNLCTYIQKFGITDQEALLEIAKIALAKEPRRFFDNIRNFGITDQDALVELAKIALGTVPELLCRSIKDFGITGQDVLVEIAKIAAATPDSGLCFFIQSFGITGHDALVEIAKIAARTPKSSLCLNIQDFGITNQKDLFEIAKIAAATPNSRLCSYIQSFGITDPRDLVEIAKIAAASPDSGLCGSIQSFGITDQAGLVEIAKIAAASPDSGLCGSIQSFDITDQAGLVEIAKIAAASPDSGLCGSIQSFGITDQAGLVEIAKIAAAIPNSGLCSYIQRFGITGQDALAEIANIAAATPYSDLFSKIQNFGITNQAALVELANIAAVTPNSGLCGNIKKFGITDQAALVEIAKIAAAIPNSDLCFYIQKFGITDQAALVEIAKIAAATPNSGLCSYIQSFGITGQDALAEIANIAAATPYSDLFSKIQSFGITDQDALVKIAKIAAAIPNSDLCLHIQKFGITDQAGLVEIAKIAAATPGTNFCRYMQNFGITDQAGLVEIAKIAAATPGTNFCRYMQNFGITDPMDLFEIAKIAASASDSEFYRYIEYYRLLDRAQREEVLKIASEHYFKTIQESIPASKRDDVKKTISAILDIRDSALRIATFDLFRSSIDNLEFQKRYFALVADGVYKFVPMIYIAHWLNEAKMPVEAIPKIINIFKHFRSDFKNARTKLSPLMLSLLRCIHQETSLSFKDKSTLLNQVCDISPDSETLKKNLGLVLSLVKLGFFHEKGIAALPESFTQKDLMDALTSKIAMPLFGKAELSPDEINSYLLLSASQRVPFALELYASAIQNAETKVEMVRFVGSVLDCSFRSLRYTPAGNSHLEALSSMTLVGASATPQSLLVRWQDLSIKDTDTPAAGGAGAGAGAAATAAASAVEEEAGLPSFGDWLVQKLISDSHLADADTKLPVLMRLLRSGKDFRTEAAKILTSGVKINDVEKACLEATCKDSKAELLISLNKLKEAAEKNTDLKGSQWIRDMQDLIQMMGSTNETSYKAQITDDWQDMFLCGTEVLGSCQAIQGNSYLNKCLLGYCMDGKIQMAVLKEPAASGKILARALLKLLIKEEKQVDGTVRRVPVIFLERVYPDNPDYTKALNELAKARARYLGLELYTHNDSIKTGVGSEVQLQSYGTSGPYEYEDGGVGISKGVYTIHRARKVVL